MARTTLYVTAWLLLGCVISSECVYVRVKLRTATSTLLQQRNLDTTPAGHDALALRGGFSSSTDVSRLLNAVDLFGTGVFAFSGTLTAARKGMDLLGMAMLSTVTAVGGGTIRDVLLGSTPVFWMRQPIYLEICVVTTLVTYFIWPYLEKRHGWKDSAKIVCVADALGIGAFAVIGTQKGVALNLNPLISSVAGLMTATFGGITRDVICQEPPRSMYPKRTMYAIHPLLGSLLYATLVGKYGAHQDRATVLAFILICSTRILSFNRPMRLPHWSQKQTQPNE